jgi:hypothetical protein
MTNRISIASSTKLVHGVAMILRSIIAVKYVERLGSLSPALFFHLFVNEFRVYNEVLF